MYVFPITRVNGLIQVYDYITLKERNLIDLKRWERGDHFWTDTFFTRINIDYAMKVLLRKAMGGPTKAFDHLTVYYIRRKSDSRRHQ